MWTRRRSDTEKVLAERYRLERELARGGMGAIWLAVDTKLDREVAIKLMAHGLAKQSEAQKRFEREALAVAKLDSNHVVQVFDYGLVDNVPYIVMERLTGESVSQRLKRIKRFSLAETLTIVSQACKGLKAAHSASLIHRDLKPSNVFIARRDDAEIVKLLDFGVVKAAGPGDSNLTQAGSIMGTPQYMSPEQARATKEIDHRSDLWSVSVIAFRMLTGRSPFKSDSVVDVILKVCSGVRPKATDYQQDLPESLDRFFETAFGPHPDERYQSAEELATALEQAIPADALATAAEAPGDSTVEQTSAGPAVAPQSDTTIVMSDSAPPVGPGTGADDSHSPAAIEAAVATPRLADAGAASPDMTIPTPATPSTTGGRFFEPTPHSATVGGTWPVAGKRSLTEPFGIVVGASVALALAGMVAVFWVGGESDVVAAPARTGLVRQVELELPAARPATPKRPVRAGDGVLDENDFDGPADPSASTSQPRPKPSGGSPRPLPPNKPQPATPPKKQNPDW